MSYLSVIILSYFFLFVKALFFFCHFIISGFVYSHPDAAGTKGVRRTTEVPAAVPHPYAKHRGYALLSRKKNSGFIMSPVCALLVIFQVLLPITDHIDSKEHTIPDQPVDDWRRSHWITENSHFKNTKLLVIITPPRS